ncbi:hypothetical protein [Rhizobium sp. BK602]|uniref:hypothetical protein n=1 Tax=Rhizobium sp. BK602 TaxID=2586986 RepID=UPI0016103B56|nr:hypothetical protein [Rhizobium sp. BK602]MBB3610360.1 hypothetical protein [Rhizobium sp. BK602]
MLEEVVVAATKPVYIAARNPWRQWIAGLSTLRKHPRLEARQRMIRQPGGPSSPHSHHKTIVSGPIARHVPSRPQPWRQRHSGCRDALAIYVFNALLTFVDSSPNIVNIGARRTTGGVE